MSFPSSVSTWRLTVMVGALALFATSGCSMKSEKPDPVNPNQQGTAAASHPGDNSGGCIEASSTPNGDILLTAGETVAVDLIEFDGDDPDCLPTTISVKPALPAGLTMTLTGKIVQLLGSSSHSTESASYEITATTDDDVSYRTSVKIGVNARAAAKE